MKFSQFSRKLIKNRKNLHKILFSRIRSILLDDQADWLKMASHYCDGFNGKKILEVGSANGILMKNLCKNFMPSEAVGIDLNSENLVISSTCRIEQGDITNASFPDNYFDIIISSNTFEHVSNFDIAMQEMYRILKDGGYMFSQFGPIWSAAHGHHLYYSHSGKTYRFNDVILPAFCHLLKTPEELFDIVSNKYSFNSEINKGIVDYIYNSPEQNRLFFEDYEKLINDSKFQVLFFNGNSSEKLNKIYKTNIGPQIFEDLRKKYPDFTNFMHNGIIVLLKK